MEFTQRQPPLTKEAAKLAPKGTYLSSIDPNLYISKDAKEIYLYFSRAGYRHWNWDLNREKFIEESAVMGVQLTTDWWNDPEAKTMPTIIEKERDRFARDASPLPYNITSYNGTGEIGYPPRKEYVLLSMSVYFLFSRSFSFSAAGHLSSPMVKIRNIGK